jgi:hypothetical protein
MGGPAGFRTQAGFTGAWSSSEYTYWLLQMSMDGYTKVCKHSIYLYGLNINMFFFFFFQLFCDIGRQES